ncbi:uncharacterized protein [Palaemon carinicauda]|uniref:uncharacterized protein n=1 Tax=Palaemon carinicauda TaxID=392227 RepID=UPI0035B5D31C
MFEGGYVLPPVCYFRQRCSKEVVFYLLFVISVNDVRRRLSSTSCLLSPSTMFEGGYVLPPVCYLRQRCSKEVKFYLLFVISVNDVRRRLCFTSRLLSPSTMFEGGQVLPPVCYLRQRCSKEVMFYLPFVISVNDVRRRSSSTSCLLSPSTMFEGGYVVPPFVDGKDELDSYLLRFERYANIHKWDRSTLASSLSALLTGNALLVHGRLFDDDAKDYEILKKALFRRYDLTEEGFRKKFRNTPPEEGESPAQFIVKLKNFLKKWMEQAGAYETFAELQQLVIKEQFINAVSNALEVHLKEKAPTNLDDLAKAAEQYLTAHGTELYKEAKVAKKPVYRPPKQTGPSAFENPWHRPNEQVKGTSARDVRCYKCNQLCHIASKCHLSDQSRGPRKDKNCMFCDKFGHDLPECRKLKTIKTAYLDVEKSVEEAQTPVAQVSSFCSISAPPPEMDVAKIDACIKEGKLFLENGFAVPCMNACVPSNEDFMPVTKGRVGSHIVRVLRDSGCSSVVIKQKFVDPDLYTGTLVLVRLADNSFRRALMAKIHINTPYLIGEVDAVCLPDAPYDHLIGNLPCARPAEDPDPAWQDTCDQETCTVATRAQAMREGGHLCAKKTKEKILREFYWPGMGVDITRFCRSCDICQKTISKGRVTKVPLEKLPIIDTPFKRVSVYIIGKIHPPSEKGHQFILTMMDHASRYPDAVPLKNIDSESVAEALVDMFSRVGVPEEILSDLGTQFTSDCMREVARLLSVRQLTTTPYHPMCNGLVEKFNGTLKQMLKKLCQEKPNQWHRYINAVLFAYREVPQESTGFSPFEILYGRSERQIKELVREYEDIFTDIPGTSNKGEHKIELTSHEPVRSKPYPVPYGVRASLRKEIKDMLDMGIIQESVSPYASPVVMVKKSDGSNRVCIDFRKLNRITMFHPEPMVTADDVFARLSESNFFTKIDFTKGYWQIKVRSEDVPKTAFVTPDGQYEFLKMPFGMVNAGATYVKCMRTLLKGLDNVESYIDDLLVHTKSWSEHLETLQELFQRIRNANLTVRPSKCILASETVQFLGHEIQGGTLSLQETNISKIQSAPQPKTKKEVRSFLGLTGFYRAYVPNYATIAAPLSDLTKKGKSNVVQWHEPQEKAYNSLKSILVNKPVLRLPDLNRRFILRTDASDVGLGAVLLQEYEDGLFPAD